MDSFCTSERKDMNFWKNLSILAVAGIVLLGLGGCGEKDDSAKSDESKKPAGARGRLAEVAREASGAASLEEEATAIRDMIEESGFLVKTYNKFPAQEMGKKGRMLVYTDKRGKDSGGILYIKKTGADVGPCWHWYFEDMVPDSVERVEINNDGLWDVRMVFKKGEVLKHVQDESFTLMAKQRSDWIAMNGSSSPASTAGDDMWRCFDGDTTTAWRSSIGPDRSPYLEFTAPFGVGEGILTIRTLPTEQPRRCTLYADGDKVQEFDLEPAAAQQMVRLDSAVKGAKKIRLVIESSYGDGSVVAVSELGLK
jgi:hypothetical protein